VGLRITAKGMSPNRRYPVRNAKQDPQNASKDTAALTWPVLSFVIIWSLTKLSGLSTLLLENQAFAQLDNKTPHISWSPQIRQCAHKTSPLERVLSQINPLYTCPPNFCKINFKMNLDSVDISEYGLEDSGFDSWQKQELFSSPKRPDRHLYPPSFIYNRYQRSFPGVKRLRRKFHTHRRLMPSLHTSWDVTPIPICAFQSCTGTSLAFFTSFNLRLCNDRAALSSGLQSKNLYEFLFPSMRVMPHPLAILQLLLLITDAEEKKTWNVRNFQGAFTITG
jgi:hypothetical protein